MLRPLLALSILLLSLGSIFTVVGIAHCQPNCSKDSMRCGDLMQCPYKGHGLPQFRLPYDDEQISNPTDDSRLSNLVEPMPTPVAPVVETITPIPATETNLSIKETANVSETRNATEIVVTETIIAGPAIDTPVSSESAESDVEPVAEPAAVEPAVEATTTNEEPSGTTESANNEDAYGTSSTNSEIDQFGYTYVANENKPVSQIKASKPHKLLITRLNKRLNSMPQMELGLRLMAHGLEARERVWQWSRDYKLERLATRGMPPDKIEAPPTLIIEEPVVPANERQWLLGFARGLNQFGALIQGASRQLEALAHDGAELQADAHSGATETR